jgi:GDPmannose 4,6-dehydratase
MKRALITGITGQDGSYLAELLVEKGYSVVGYKGDVTDYELLAKTITKEKPDELYNLASIATVAKPWDDTLRVLQVTGLAPVALLEILRKESPRTKFFQASSAEMFGDPENSPQSERTPFRPKNPYGMGKLLAHLAVGQYRVQHDLFAVSGILFNHESPRREEGFVTRKITRTLARIQAGVEKELVVGNVNAIRDWGFAGDYVEAMWQMLQADVPDDYVIASGKTHTVRDFINATAKALNFKIVWEGNGENEVGKDMKGNIVVRVSKDFYRLVEKVDRCGDISKIKKTLGWKPKTSFEDLVRMMVIAEK